MKSYAWLAIIAVIAACAAAWCFLTRKQDNGVTPTAPTLPSVEEKNMAIREMKIVNVPMPLANTEYVWQLPVGIKRFTLHVRDGTAIRISTERNKVVNYNEPYWTQAANSSWSEWDLNIEEDKFLYFACALAGKTIEIIVGV